LRGVAQPYEQGRSAQCYPYTETETPLPILSPCRVPWHYGVFPLGNIGGVPAGRGGWNNGGVKKYLQQRKRIKATRQLSALLLYATKNKRDYKNKRCWKERFV